MFKNIVTKSLVVLFLVCSICLVTNSKCLADSDSTYDIHIYQEGDTIPTKYRTSSREFAAIPTVEVTGSRIWAAWMSGGDKEPHKDNYIVVGFSDDGGNTWVEPVMIIDPVEDTERTYNPVFWLSPEGRLWLYFGNVGWFQCYCDNPEAKRSELVFSTPVYQNRSIVFNKPIVITNSNGKTEYILPTQNYTKPLSDTQVYSSLDYGITWTLKGTATSTLSVKNHHEPMMVEMPNGTLWMLSRIENGTGGGIEQSFSTDKGTTWTNYQYDLPSPLKGPGSRFNFYVLSNGNLVFVSNDSTSSREKMTIFMSEDFGETWPYKLCIDDRTSVSYPDICQDSEGNIYVVYDKGRSKEQEIRMCKVTSDDIKSGEVGSNSYIKKIVTKTGDYEDIVYVDFSLPFDNTIYVGDSIDEYFASLPQSFVVETDKGNTYTLSGTWRKTGLTTKEGNVVIYFDTFLPSKVSDTYTMLQIKFKVLSRPSDKKGGCQSSISITSLTVLLSVLGLSIIRRKKKYVS